MNAHERAVRTAIRAGDEIDRLIARLGTAEHPRGEVLTAYRNAERGLHEVLRAQARRAVGVSEVLRGLRRDVQGTARETLRAAAAAGMTLGQRQAEAQGLETPGGAPGYDLFAMENAWLAAVDGQIATATALATLGADEAEILGDDSRAGVLRPAVIVAEGARWVAGAVNGAMVAYWGWLIGRQGGGTAGRETWYHQAVAAIDERTTDCCLRVHGQVQRLDKPFHLTGTPRYADYLLSPPFHWYCRSAEVLLTPEQAQDELTGEMVAAARAELFAREQSGTRVEIHPAHARSRR